MTDGRYKLYRVNDVTFWEPPTMLGDDHPVWIMARVKNTKGNGTVVATCNRPYDPIGSDVYITDADVPESKCQALRGGR